MRLESLEWELPSQEVTNLPHSMLLGADLVYSAASVKPLVSTIEALLEGNASCEILFAHSTRNPDTDANLFNALSQLGLYLQQVAVSQKDKRVKVYHHCSSR
jgi:hypothetical protein